ncbi:hypothetical protein ASE21_14560 [Flavobacterium sp. Root901]|uniref:hypothetical protein n=1 Tax=Flavobacterium sp. Root901 TaxID=1736605 RepID=UPI0007109F29|nr:hypothetical protein [Flavobacterium sp. Root901]KRD09070.1 hypothetical protein ASE21_14560 [Flavobacterium sp. Root901]
MNESISTWKEKQKNYLAVSIASLLIGTYFFMNVINGSYIIKQSDLQVYENLIISTTPKFKERKGKHRRKWIEFKCINNRSTFEIASYDYNCVKDDEVINEIKEGDTISVAILKSEIGDFDTESSCEIHSLVKNNKEYLNLDCRNEVDNNGGKRGFLLLFTISTLTAIVYSLSKKPKIFDEVNPEFLITVIIIILFFILASIL